MEYEFWENAQGEAVVVTDIQQLDSKLQAKIIWVLDRFKEVGLRLGMPHLKKLHLKNQQDLYEFRFKMNNNCFRILFVVRKNVAYLLYSFSKKENSTASRHIKTALQRASSIK